MREVLQEVPDSLWTSSDYHNDYDVSFHNHNDISICNNDDNSICDELDDDKHEHYKRINDYYDCFVRKE